MAVTYVSIPASTKARVRVLLVARHVYWNGGLHETDGNHALYHLEMRQVLEEIGINLHLADCYEALFERPDADFIFPLLNRGGFLNSEMLLPLLCTRHHLPFLGASPILRGQSDDKHLAKLEARALGVPTIPWTLFRRGAPVDERNCPMAERMVVKPNASSASWGVTDASDWMGVRAAIGAIHAGGHDAIVEPFIEGCDVEVPVIGYNGAPTILPMTLYEQSDPTHLRTNAEKRDLVESVEKFRLVAFDDPYWVPRVAALTQKLAAIYHPFDYGRYEFRLDQQTGRLLFMEVNLNCNLWSEKTFGRSAVQAGMTHMQLVETILAESMARQGLMSHCDVLAA